MNKLIHFLLFCLLGSQLWATSLPLHEFHVSKCNIEYKASSKAIQITVHLFIDDLEEAFRQKGTEELFIGTAKEKENADQFIHHYLKEKFSLKSEETELEFNFIGKEQSEDLAAIYCYLEIANLADIKQLTVTNNILMDIFADQKNITSISGPNNKSAYYLFQQGKTTDSIDF